MSTEMFAVSSAPTRAPFRKARRNRGFAANKTGRVNPAWNSWWIKQLPRIKHLERRHLMLSPTPAYVAFAINYLTRVYPAIEPSSANRK